MDNPRTDVGLLKTVSMCLLDRKCPCGIAGIGWHGLCGK